MTEDMTFIIFKELDQQKTIFSFKCSVGGLMT